MKTKIGAIRADWYLVIIISVIVLLFENQIKFRAKPSFYSVWRWGKTLIHRDFILLISLARKFDTLSYFTHIWGNKENGAWSKARWAEERIFRKKFIGDAGYRSPYLSHAKRALYHLSYIPNCYVLTHWRLKHLQGNQTGPTSKLFGFLKTFTIPTKSYM